MVAQTGARPSSVPPKIGRRGTIPRAVQAERTSPPSPFSRIRPHFSILPIPIVVAILEQIPRECIVTMLPTCQLFRLTGEMAIYKSVNVVVPTISPDRQHRWTHPLSTQPPTSASVSRLHPQSLAKLRLLIETLANNPRLATLVTVLHITCPAIDLGPGLHTALVNTSGLRELELFLNPRLNQAHFLGTHSALYDIPFSVAPGNKTPFPKKQSEFQYRFQLRKLSTSLGVSGKMCAFLRRHGNYLRELRLEGRAEGSSVKPPSLPLLCKFSASSSVLQWVVPQSTSMSELSVLDGKLGVDQLLPMLPKSLRSLECFAATLDSGAVQKLLEALPSLQMITLNIAEGPHVPSVRRQRTFMVFANV